jgi:hypothetical protein
MCFIWIKPTLIQSQTPQYLQKTNAYRLLTVQYKTMLVSIDSSLSKRAIDLIHFYFNPKPHKVNLEQYLIMFVCLFVLDNIELKIAFVNCLLRSIDWFINASDCFFDQSTNNRCIMILGSRSISAT